MTLALVSIAKGCSKWAIGDGEAAISGLAASCMLLP